MSLSRVCDDCYDRCTQEGYCPVPWCACACRHRAAPPDSVEWDEMDPYRCEADWAEVGEL